MRAAVGVIGVVGMVGVVGVLGMAGCVTERVVSSDGRSRPSTPHASAAAPRGVAPNRMTLVHAPAEDSDGNGYKDAIVVQASLFALPNLTPIEEPEGSFVFSLYRQGDSRRGDAEPIAAWTFEAPEIASARERRLYGTSFAFTLSLLDFGTDAMAPVAADLRGHYVTPDGEIVRASDELRPVQLGRR